MYRDRIKGGKLPSESEEASCTIGECPGSAEGSFEIFDPKFKAKLIIFYTASLTMLNCSDGGGLDKSKIGF